VWTLALKLLLNLRQISLLVESNDEEVVYQAGVFAVVLTLKEQHPLIVLLLNLFLNIHKASLVLLHSHNRLSEHAHSVVVAVVDVQVTLHVTGVFSSLWRLQKRSRLAVYILNGLLLGGERNPRWVRFTPLAVFVVISRHVLRE
jgi:hypothetical protein